VDGDKGTTYYYSGGVGTQYIDIYLNGGYTNIRKINMWHYFYDGRTYHNVLRQVSEDRVKWYTIYDSDEQGEYVETSKGHTVYVDKMLLNGYIKVDSNVNEVEIRDMFVQAQGTDMPAVYGYNTNWFLFINGIILGDRNHDNAYYCSGSNCRLNNTEVNFASNTLVMCAYGGRLELIDCTGGGAKYGMYAHGSGLIGGSGKAPLGSDATNPVIIKNYGGTYSASHVGTLGELSPATATTPVTAPTTTTTVTKIKTWTSTSGASWNGGSGSWHTSDSDVLQGKYGSYGLYRGLWFFPSDMRTTCMGAKSITKVRFYFTRANTSGNVNDAVHQIRTHGYLSKPSSAPSYSSAYKQVVADRGQSQWVDVTSVFASSFKAGSVYGMCLYSGSTASSNYTRCKNVAKVEVTYTVTV